ncbi:MAG TPA: T9SS type A sorting domain-containing protein, partial [Ignavibacteriaceae bacterium]
IKFSLPERTFVELKIYNILGIEIATIEQKELDAGNYAYTFNAENLSSGIYLYKLNAGKFSITKKMTLIK